MQRQWTICTLFGIKIQLHWTFALMPLLFGYAFGLKGLFVVAFVFLCVTLHELCHALQARRFGIGARHIVLYPIGGVAQLHSFGRRPKEELLTSIAGPLFNLVLAAILFAPAYLWLGPELLFDRHVMFRVSTETWRHTLASCFWINPLLGLFNLIPAFPMDGGRMLRSALASRWGLQRATRAAIGVGRVFMAGFVVIGLLSNPWLLVIAAFLYFAGEQEAGQVELQVFLAQTRVRDLPSRRIMVLAPTTTLAHALELAFQSGQDDFPVVENGRLVGLLGREALSRVVRGQSSGEEVSAWMRRDVPTATPDDTLDVAYQRMVQARLAAVPVLEGHTVLSVVSVEDIQRVAKWAEHD